MPHGAPMSIAATSRPATASSMSDCRNISSRATARASRRPISLSTNCGERPSPGLLLVSIARAIVVFAGNLGRRHQTLAEHASVQCLASRDPAVRHAERQLHLADGAHLLGELRRFEARLVVGSAHRPIERQMPLEQARAHGDGGERDGGAVVVARVADGPAGPFAQPFHEPQVDLLRRRRIRADAVEQRVFRVALLEERQRPAHLLFGRHPRRQQHWLAGGRHVLDQGKVGEVRRPDLVGRQIAGLEKIDAGAVPWRAHRRDPAVVAIREQLPELVVRQLELDQQAGRCTGGPVRRDVADRRSPRGRSHGASASGTSRRRRRPRRRRPRAASRSRVRRCD